MHFVKSARHVVGCQLILGFEDGTYRIVDLEPHLDGEVFQPLKDPDYFRAFQVSADLDTIVWPNGADVAPETLYEEAHKSAVRQ